MGYLNLKNLKKIIATGIVLAIAACLIPEPAQADDDMESLIAYSGSPNAGVTRFNFIVNTSVSESEEGKAKPEVGIFPGAIQNAKYICLKIAEKICDRTGEFFFQPGELKASPITTLEDIKNYPLQEDRFIGGVKYEARLNSENSSDFLEIGILVEPSDNLDLINSLSNLKSVINNDIFNTSIYIGVRNLNSQDGDFLGGFNKVSTATKVPEPKATATLLTAGALSALSLLNRNRRSRRIFENKLIRSQ